MRLCRDATSGIRTSRPDVRTNGAEGVTGDWYDVRSVERSGNTTAPPLPAPPGGDQIVVLRGIPWAQYDALCRSRTDTAGPRLAYLDGDLEIMSPGRRHETAKTVLARLLEIFALENRVSLNGFGSETFRKKAKKAGLEPDECYSIGHARKFPDLAIEVVETSGGVDKLEAYRRLGIREVWYLIDARIYVYSLEHGRYRLQNRSVVLPQIDLGEIARIATSTNPERQTEAVAAFWRTLRRRKRTKKRDRSARAIPREERS